MIKKFISNRGNSLNKISEKQKKKFIQFIHAFVNAYKDYIIKVEKEQLNKLVVRLILDVQLKMKLSCEN